MKQINKITIPFLLLIWIPKLLFAQIDYNELPTDDLGVFSDKYQEHFYEALKQKGIENYERSISELQECLSIDTSNAVIYFELGKNYIQLKRFDQAEDALQKAASMEPENEWYLDELYGVYYNTNNYDKALQTLKQLTKFHSDYKEELANLYYKHQNYKDALQILDELDQKRGISTSREKLRNQIYNASGDDNGRIDYLNTKVKQNPNGEYNYLKLIYLYSQLNNKKKAFDTALQLLEKKPQAHLPHLALYKFYLDDKQYEKAIQSMTVVTQSNQINPDAKTKVLNDFIAFVKQKPQFENHLLDITNAIVESEDAKGKTDTELAEFYLQKNNKEKALQYFKKALEKDANNFENIKHVLLLSIDINDNETVVELASNTLEIFPAQPILYLLKGVAHNKLNEPDKAILSLETGLDYIIDNTIMEADFYSQLSYAFKLKNNITKAETFTKKAETLLNKI